MPSLNPTGKILHLTRHGEAEHNVDDDYSSEQEPNGGVEFH